MMGEKTAEEIVADWRERSEEIVAAFNNALFGGDVDVSKVISAHQELMDEVSAAHRELRDRW